MLNKINKNTKIFSTNQCAGKNCKDIGIKSLKIHYIKKVGFFCKRCAEELIANNLAEEVYN